MPRKHVNLKIESTKFQVSVLDPYFHRSYNQVWTPSARNPQLVAGQDWKATDLSLDLTRAMDQAVLACSTLSKKLRTNTYESVQSIIVHISRNDVTFLLEMTEDAPRNDILLQYTWDQNAQLIAPDNFEVLSELGLSQESQSALRDDLTQCSFGRLGLVARCLRLMAAKTYQAPVVRGVDLAGSQIA